MVQEALENWLGIFQTTAMFQCLKRPSVGDFLASIGVEAYSELLSQGKKSWTPLNYTHLA